MAKAEIELLKEILAELKLIREAIENKEDDDDKGEEIEDEPEEDDNKDVDVDRENMD